jgi:YD repeat-containing protein
MKRFTRIIQTLFIVFSGIVVYAQDEDLSSFNLPNQRGNIPVNMVTGAPSLNIPLCSVSDGTLSVPVIAYYSSSGMRPSDTPSELGLQWGLSAGGSITQLVRSGNNILFISPIAHCIDNEATIVNPDEHFLNGASNGKFDIEPDIFSVNAPGLSCDFMLEGDTGFILLTKSNIKIEYLEIEDNTSVGFKITSDNGTKYYFDIVKYSKYYQYEGRFPDLTDTKFNKSFVWLLTKMEDADNLSQILFNYQNNDTSFNEEYLFCYGQYSQQQDSVTSLNMLRFEEKTRLSSVETPNEKIVFHYDTIPGYESPYAEYQKDGYTYDRIENFVKSIEVKDKNEQLLKSFEFNYYVNINNRVFLSEIIEKNKFGNPLPSHKFSYYNPDRVTGVFSLDIDFWGYQNKTDTLLSFFQNMFPMGDCSGMIKEVFYPEGGYTKYHYEPNQYRMIFDLVPMVSAQWSAFLNEYEYTDFTSLRGGGYRISKIEDFDGKVRTGKTFEYQMNIGSMIVSSGQLSAYPLHKLNYPAKFYVDSIDSGNVFWQNIGFVSANSIGIEEGTVVYDKITVYENGLTKNSSGEKFGINGKTDYVFNIQGPYTQTLHDPDFPYYMSLFGFEESSAVKQKIVYDNANRILNEQENNFNIVLDENIKRTGLKLIDKEYLLIEKYGEYTPEPIGVYYKSWYEQRQKNIRLTSTMNKTFNKDNADQFIENQKTFSYSRNGIDYMYPVKITETESNGDIMETHLYYPRDFANGSNVYQEMLNRNILSPVIKKEIFKNGTRIGGENTVYKLFTNDRNQILIVPDCLQILEDGTYKTAQIYKDYTEKGISLSSVGIDSIYQSVILNDDETEVIAVVGNAEADEIYHTSFEFGEETGNDTIHSKTGEKSYSGSFTFNLPEKAGTYLITYWKLNGTIWEYVETEITNPGSGSPYTVNSGTIDELRVIPTDAYMGTSTIKPYVGKTSETDANNNTVYYEYDDFDRLSKVYDQDRVLLKEYSYHISPLAYESPTSHFTVSSDFTGSFLSGCQAIHLSIAPDSSLQNNSDQIVWQWFDDGCGGNLIKESDELFLDIVPLADKPDYFVRPVVNGYCLPCGSQTFTIFEGALLLGGNTVFEYTIHETHRPETVNYFYDACDLQEPKIVINDRYEDHGWLNITLNTDLNTLVFTFEPDYNITETEEMCVEWYGNLFFFTREAL